METNLGLIKSRNEVRMLMKTWSVGLFQINSEQYGLQENAQSDHLVHLLLTAALNVAQVMASVA